MTDVVEGWHIKLCSSTLCFVENFLSLIYIIYQSIDEGCKGETIPFK